MFYSTSSSNPNRSLTAAVFDVALNFRDAYIPNYPIGPYRIDDEMANNVAFKAFVEVSFMYKYSVLSIDRILAMCSPLLRSPTRHEIIHQQAYSSVTSAGPP